MGAARVLVLFVAVGAAAAAGLFMWSAMSQKAPPQIIEAARSNSDTIKVLVAAKDLPRGVRIDANAVRLRDWPKSASSSAFLIGDQAIDQVKDGIVRIQMIEGEPVSLQKIARTNESGFLSALVEPGMRAVAAAISSTSGVSGFILPGDRVDVTLTRQLSSRGNRGPSYVAETILENIKVLAVNELVAAEDGADNISGKTVTLELTPRETERLLAAQATGDIHLSLRSLDLEGVSADDLRIAESDAGRGVKVTRFGQTSRAGSRGL